MLNVRVMAVAALGVVVLGAQVVAEMPFQYREYALESSVASVVKISNTREDGTKTLHARPARIEQVEWRAPYVSWGTERADPVRDVVFSFYDDQLYQLVVTYDRDRMAGLTNDDVVESISAVYGVPLLRHSPKAGAVQRVAAAADTMVVAQWEDAGALLTLTRNTYSPEFKLVLISKTLHARAVSAITEALRLDTEEAPQRALDQRKKDLAVAEVASQKARLVNKAAFKP